MPELLRDTRDVHTLDRSLSEPDEAWARLWKLVKGEGGR